MSFSPILSLRELIAPLHTAITIKDFQLMKGMFTEFSLPGVALLILKNIMILMKQNHRKQLHFSGSTNNHRLESSTQLDSELIWNANGLYFVFISLPSLRAS